MGGEREKESEKKVAKNNKMRHKQSASELIRIKNNGKVTSHCLIWLKQNCN